MDNELLVLVIVGILAAIPLYFLPTLFAWSRGHKNLTAIFVLNIFLGWALVGWVVALVWALLAEQKRSDPRPPPSVNVIYTCPHCGRSVQISATLLGHTVACGSCGKQFTATHTAPPVR